VTLNPYGEMPQHVEGSDIAKNGSGDLNAPKLGLQKSGEKLTNRVLPTFESFDFKKSDVMEEDLMGCEPGLVYFEVSVCYKFFLTYLSFSFLLGTQ
jgi:hypothetical protein